VPQVRTIPVGKLVGTEPSRHVSPRRPPARIIHERFYCNRGFATATSLHASLAACRRAGSPLRPSPYCF